jgi:predicted nuclease of restriction endonuclease-like RecB superfamily
MIKKPKPRKVKGVMNDLEQRFYDTLIRGQPHEVLLGDIVRRVYYEEVTLKLAPKTTYTPDFLVIGDEHMCFVETKGFWRDDARVKFKVAADKFGMFSFMVVTWTRKGGFEYEYL